MFLYLNIDSIMHISSFEDVKIILISLLCTLAFINPNTFSNMWYMPMILCVYTILPILGIAVKRIPAKYVFLPINVIIMSGFVLPCFTDFLQLSGSNLSFYSSLSPIISIYFVYVLLGYYISIGLLEHMKSGVLILFSVFSFIAACAYQVFAYSRPIDYAVSYQSISIVLISTLLFEVFRRFCSREFRFQAQIVYLSKISFGIYFIHICIMQFICDYCHVNLPKPLMLIFLETVSVGASILIIRIFSKIPFFKKYVFTVRD